MNFWPGFKIRCILLLVALVCAKISWAIPPSTAYSPTLKSDPVTWSFRTQVEAQGLIVQHINQPRAIYYIINQSYRSNLEGYVAMNLYQRLKKDADNPKLIVMTAYAIDQSDGDGSRGLWGGGSADAKALMSSRSVIWGLVTDEVCRQLKDPTLILMASVVREVQLYESGTSYKFLHAREWTSCLALSRRAMILAPQWADAKYWNAQSLLGYSHDAQNLPVQERNRILLKAKDNLLAAVRLDAGLKSDCYFQLAFVLEALNQPKDALTYFVQAQKLRHPGYAIDPAGAKRTVERLQRKINQT